LADDLVDISASKGKDSAELIRAHKFTYKWRGARSFGGALSSQEKIHGFVLVLISRHGIGDCEDKSFEMWLLRIDLLACALPYIMGHKETLTSFMYFFALVVVGVSPLIPYA